MKAQIKLGRNFVRSRSAYLARHTICPSRLGGKINDLLDFDHVARNAIHRTKLVHQTHFLGRRATPNQAREQIGVIRKTITAPGLLRRQLATIRQSGLAFEAEESAVGVTCVAAPILDAAMLPAAALSVTGTTSSFKPEAHAGAVAAAAAGISEGLGRLRRLGL